MEKGRAVKGNCDPQRFLTCYKKLKASCRIAYADCFAATLSLKLRATLVTGDPEFRQLEEKIPIQWIHPKG